MTISATTQGLRPGVCTSSNRPANPYDGMMIYETDTNLVRIWNGTAWKTLSYSDYTNGSVIQVQSTTVSAITATTTSTSLVDIADMSVTITPTSSTSKVFVSVNMYIGSTGDNDDSYYQLLRGSTEICQSTGATLNRSAYVRFGTGDPDNLAVLPITIQHLDSPASASATTYKMQWATRVGGLRLNRRGENTAFGTASSITAMEIAG